MRIRDDVQDEPFDAEVLGLERAGDGRLRPAFLNHLRREVLVGEGADSHGRVPAERAVRAGERRPPVTRFSRRHRARAGFDRDRDSRAVQRVERQGRVADVALQAGVADRREERPRVAHGLHEIRRPLEIRAHDIYFDPATITAPAGEIELDLVQEGSQTHTLVIDGVDDFKLSVSNASRDDSGTIDLKSGEYTYYCDIPGHRSQGMEGTITLT